MKSQDLVSMFDWNYRALQTNLDGIDAAAAEAAPQPGGNSLNWVLGHIVFSRDVILKMVGQPSVLTEEELKAYQRGVNPSEIESWTPLPRLKEALDVSQERLISALERLTAEQLHRAEGSEDEGETAPSLGDSLRFLHFHEAYHVGQTGLLRRLAGRAGAI